MFQLFLQRVSATMKIKQIAGFSVPEQRTLYRSVHIMFMKAAATMLCIYHALQIMQLTEVKLFLVPKADRKNQY